MNRRGFLSRAAAFLAALMIPWRPKLTDADADVVVWYDREGNRYSFDSPTPSDASAKRIAKKIEFTRVGDPQDGEFISQVMMCDSGKRVQEIHIGQMTKDRRDYRFIRNVPIDWCRPWEKGPCTWKEATKA